MHNASLKRTNPGGYKPERVPAALKVMRQQHHTGNPSIHYGIWPEVPTQHESDMHAYILCVEVDSFDGVPEWYFKTTLPPQKCVVVPNKEGDYDAACRVVDQYVADNGIGVGADERKYIICERYNYEGEGFAKYSLPIQSMNGK